MRRPINFLIVYLKEVVYLKGIGAEKRTILKWILEKRVRVCGLDVAGSGF